MSLLLVSVFEYEAQSSETSFYKTSASQGWPNQIEIRADGNLVSACNVAIGNGIF
jgi:hypothetical protein